MDVIAWLRGLGLERYASAFRDNDIDGGLLRQLTAEDLRELGVASVGHRRRLLDAIASFDASTPAADPPGRAAETIATLAPAPADAERRQLTVMFCDLVGSTELSARLDPEDLREVIAAYHRAVADVVRSLDGFVAKYMGDGVLIYFGYPRAHEDDAERAVRAGLGVIDAVGRLDVGSGKLQARVGIATGLVVVGDLIGEGSAQEQSVVGETPNLAARLQSRAEPNAVVIAAGTRRLVGDLFEYRDLGAVEVKGIAGPVPASQVLRPSAVASRFEALRSGETPLVGRDEELELLRRRWDQAKTGAGRVVLISAEPGIGKSRLAEAFRESLEGEPHTRLRYFCSVHHQDSALFPIISQLERAAGFAGDDSPEAKLDKLQALVSTTDPATDVPLLAELLSVPLDGRYPALDLTPQRKKEKTFEALLRQLAGLAERQPVLMIYEDLHWADPTSRELMDLTVEHVARLPALLIATFRPEFQPHWTGQPQVTTLSLRRLGRDESDELVRGIIGNVGALSSEVIDEIVERTDGVPLFLEEVTKAVLETAALGAIPAASATVPATLHASLMARLDRLGPMAKEVAQVGAAIGRDFSYELLAAVAQPAQAEVRDALGRLANAGLVFQRGTPPNASFLFKHALVQDTAYSMLLRGPRQALHARIAEALEQRFPTVVEMQPEILAHHFAQGAMPIAAVDYWIKAGDLARRRSAYAEATAHLLKGLELIPALPEPKARTAKELTIQTALGQLYMATKGYGSAEAEAAYARASDLCAQIDDRDQFMRVLIGLRTVNQVQGRFLAAKNYAAKALELAKRERDRVFTAQAYSNLGHTCCYMGCFAEARAHLADALAAYDPSDHLVGLLIAGHDPGTKSLSTMAWNEWFLGYPDRALAAAREAITQANGRGHPQNLEDALNSAGNTHLLRGEPDAALGCLEAAWAISQDQGYRMRIAMLRVLRGWALSAKGDDRGALIELSEGLAEYRATGAQASLTQYLALLAEGYRRAGRITEGQSAIAEARALEGEKWWAAELHRIEGDLLLASATSREGQAEQSYRNAIETACQQQAKSWELRACRSLARLWRDQGRHAEARDLLAPVYGWFTEGFDTADLKDAKALLDELT
jgi:class 3 adenylate cyclase/predicted ATPase/DNA polymerase III delta prime subunit